MRKLPISLRGNTDLTGSFLFFRSLLLQKVRKTSKKAESNLWTIQKSSLEGKKLGKRYKSKNTGSMGCSPNFDTFCGRAAKLPNLCASDLSLPTVPPPPLWTYCLSCSILHC